MCGTQRKSSSKVELRQQAEKANFIKNQPNPCLHPMEPHLTTWTSPVMSTVAKYMKLEQNEESQPIGVSP